MDEADSKAAVAAAERAKVTTAVWLGQAIRERIAREREELPGEVLQPGNGTGTQLVPVDSQPPQPRRLELHDLVQMARAMTPPDKDSEAMRLARSMVRDRLKALREAEA